MWVMILLQPMEFKGRTRSAKLPAETVLPIVDVKDSNKKLDRLMPFTVLVEGIGLFRMGRGKQVDIQEIDDELFLAGMGRSELAGDVPEPDQAKCADEG